MDRRNFLLYLKKKVEKYCFNWKEFGHSEFCFQNRNTLRIELSVKICDTVCCSPHPQNAVS